MISDDTVRRLRFNLKDTVYSLVFISLWCFSYFDGLSWLAQFALFRKLVIPTNAPVGLLLFFTFAIIVAKRRLLINYVGLIFLILFSYITVTNFIIVTFLAEPDLSRHLLIAHLFIGPAYYLLISSILLSQWRISESVADKAIIFMGVISIIVACAQQLYGYSPLELLILNAAHADNYYFFGATRPTSIFLIPGEYGVFIAILIVLSLSFLLKQKQSYLMKILYVLISCGLMFAEYFAYARDGILIMACASIFTLVFYYNRSWWRVVYAPIMAFFLGFIVYISAPMLSTVIHSKLGSMASDASVIIRYKELIAYTGMVFDGSITHAVFGTGLKQFVYLNRGIYIDNTYLYILLQGGIVGLLLWGGAMWGLWKLLYNRTIAAPTPLRVALLSVLASWPAVAFFISSQQYLILIFLALAISSQPLTGTPIWPLTVPADKSSRKYTA